MIEKTVLDYLISLDLKKVVMSGYDYAEADVCIVVPGEQAPQGAVDIPCYMERPEKKPDDMYIIVEKTGSELENHLPDATIAISSYGPSLYEASVLNDAVKHVMMSIPELAEVSAVRLNSDYNFTSTTLKEYRYQAVFVLTYYEED